MSATWNPGPGASSLADSFQGNDDPNLADGLDGSDTLLGLGGDDSLIGGNGNDSIDGGSGADSINAGSGADTVFGGGDNDTIISETGSEGDVLSGGDGADTISAGSGADSIDGGDGADTINARDGTNTVTGGSGDDSIFSGLNADSIEGGDGADTIIAGNGSDTIDGGDGNDRISGGQGHDVIRGGTGADSLSGGSSFDTIFGGDGADTIGGDNGEDFLEGGPGDDNLSGGAGNDTISYQDAAGGGVIVNLLTNRATGAAGSDAGSDTLSSIEAVIGSAFADTLTGGTGNNTLVGGDGHDSLDGGAGDDVASYADASGGVLVDLNTPAQTTGGAGNDTLVNIEGVIGSDHADTLTGAVGNNTILAGDGNDQVFEGGGNNSLDGGDGTDRLTFSTVGFYDITRDDGTGALTIRFLGADSAEEVDNPISTAVNFEEFTYNAGTFNLTAPGWGGTDMLYVCFAAGTRIQTATGEVAVEQLQPGDRVVTLAGRGLPVKPVLWVGRRHVVLAGRADAAEMAPIRIKPGALGANTPKRDLVVSPDHCLYLDGALVPARLLVNGRSVVAEVGIAEVTWYHVELETHEVLVAEGAAAESWLDCGNRSWFQNAPVAMLTVPGNLDAVGTGWDASRACAPLVHGGDQLARIRAALDARAEALTITAPEPARMAR